MAAHQALPSLGFSRQEHWSGLPFPSPVHEKWKVKVKSLSHARPSATPWTAAYQAPPSTGFSRQEYWSGVPLPELTHWKRPWCWEGLKAGGEGDDRGWDAWMASPTWWTWIWESSRSWWWIGKPGVLQSLGSQIVGHDWVTELKKIWGQATWCRLNAHIYEPNENKDQNTISHTCTWTLNLPEDFFLTYIFPKV